MKQNESAFTKFLKSGFTTLLMAIISVVCAIVAVYVTARTQPFDKADALLDLRVKAIENDYARSTTVKSGFDHIEKSLKKLEEGQTLISNKLDKALER